MRVFWLAVLLVGIFILLVSVRRGDAVASAVAGMSVGAGLSGQLKDVRREVARDG